MRKLFLCILLLTCATQLVAQADAAPTTAIDDKKLAAAKRLMGITMPPARQTAMIEGMVRALTNNSANGMRNSPELAKLFASDPRITPIFDRFLARIEEDSTKRLKAGMPGMFEAMTRAYARRFTVEQMSELSVFFATPTGQLYMDQGATIMSDPDVATWQRKMVVDAMANVPEQARTLRAEILALDPPVKSQ